MLVASGVVASGSVIVDAMTDHKHVAGQEIPVIDTLFRMASLMMRLQHNRRLYVYEGVELAIFMVLACVFTVFLFDPSFRAFRLLPSAAIRSADAIEAPEEDGIADIGIKQLAAAGSIPSTSLNAASARSIAVF
jgi:hypothetical protein